jgi:hypothetical protein
MKTNSFFTVKTSSYLDSFFLLLPIEHCEHPLFGLIKPDLVSTDGSFLIFIQNSNNYRELTDYFKRRKEQLRLTYVEFYEPDTYNLIPEALFDILGQDTEPSEHEIGYDLNNKSISQ